MDAKTGYFNGLTTSSFNKAPTGTMGFNKAPMGTVGFNKAPTGTMSFNKAPTGTVGFNRGGPGSEIRENGFKFREVPTREIKRIHMEGGCAGTRYGCMPDGKTPRKGPSNSMSSVDPDLKKRWTIEQTYKHRRPLLKEEERQWYEEKYGPLTPLLHHY